MPKNKIGEGPIALADSIGINSSSRKVDVQDNVLYVLLPATGLKKPLTLSQIDSSGHLHFKKGMLDNY